MSDKAQLLSYAKRMRHVPTEAESAIWRQLRAGRLADYRFKRQKPIGNFIVDFVCFAQKLVIEVDGGQHTDLKARDEARMAWLQAQGFRVLRFWNHDVLQRRDMVLEDIRRNSKVRCTHLSPCGRGRRACAAGEGQAKRSWFRSHHSVCLRGDIPTKSRMESRTLSLGAARLSLSALHTLRAP